MTVQADRKARLALDANTRNWLTALHDDAPESSTTRVRSERLIAHIDALVAEIEAVTAENTRLREVLIGRGMEVLRLAHIYALKDSHPEELPEDFKPEKWTNEVEFAEESIAVYREVVAALERLKRSVPGGGVHLSHASARAREEQLRDALTIVKRRDYGSLNHPDHIDPRTTVRVVEDALAAVPAARNPEPCGRCKGRGTITYYPPRRDGAYPIACPDCAARDPEDNHACPQCGAPNSLLLCDRCNAAARNPEGQR